MKIGSIVIHWHEFEKMVEFWQDALHYRPRDPLTDDWAVLQDPLGKGESVIQKRENRKSIEAGYTSISIPTDKRKKWNA